VASDAASHSFGLGKSSPYPLSTKCLQQTPTVYLHPYVLASPTTVETSLSLCGEVAPPARIERARQDS